MNAARIMGLFAVGVVLATTACSSAAADEQVGSSASAASQQTPLFVHYGFLQQDPIPVNASGRAAAKAQMKKLIVPNAENVVVSTRPFADPDGAHQAWKAAGGLLAKRLSMEAVVAELDAKRDPVAAALGEGFDLVAIDELHPKKAAAVNDRGRARGPFVKMLADHNDKVILLSLIHI